MKNYSFIRIAPLETKSRGDGSLGKALGHLDKHKDSAEISKPELSVLNKCFIEHPKSYKQCVKVGADFLKKHNDAIDKYNVDAEKSIQNIADALGIERREITKEQITKYCDDNGIKDIPVIKRHMRSNSTQFFEGVCTYSPDMEGSIDLDKWSQKTYEFLKQEYEAKGCEILRCDLHCDENSIHMQFVCACFDETKQNCTYRNIAGGKASLSQLQDRYGDAMSEFGLIRGRSRYQEAKRIEYDAAEYFHTTVDKLTDTQLNAFCVINHIKMPDRVRHNTVKDYKNNILFELGDKIAMSKKQHQKVIDDIALKEQEDADITKKLEQHQEDADIEIDRISKQVQGMQDDLLYETERLRAAKQLADDQELRNDIKLSIDNALADNNLLLLYDILNENKGYLEYDARNKVQQVLNKINSIYDELTSVAQSASTDLLWQNEKASKDIYAVLNGSYDIPSDIPQYDEPTQNTPSRDDDEAR